jgi:hypothetical protein
MPGVGAGRHTASRSRRAWWWLLAGLAFAAARPLPAAETGWYAGVSMGVSKQDLPASFWIDSPGTTGSVDPQGVVYDVYGGYRLLPNLALEAGYLHPGDAEFEGQTDGVRSRWVEGDIRGWVMTQGVRFQAVGIWPATSTLEVFAKGGLYFFNTESDYFRLITSLNNTNVGNSTPVNPVSQFEDDGVYPIGGVGIEWRAWRGWKLRGEWQYTQVNVEKKASAPVYAFLLGISRAIP